MALGYSFLPRFFQLCKKYKYYLNRTLVMARKRKRDTDEEGDAKLPAAKRKTDNATDSEAAAGKTNWSDIKCEDLKTTNDGRKWTTKVSTWNVNGVRAWLKNGGMEYIQHEDPDIFCLQETKCQEKELPMTQLTVPGYSMYWYSAEKKGYSGVGLYSKEKPLEVTKGLGNAKFDNEGRLITAEYKDFYLLTSYVPNAGEGLKRLDYKMEWDVELREYMKKLDAKKPVILCGDLNVAHQEIDLKNPKSNHKTAGFTPEERKDFSLLLDEGFVDLFRHLNPDLEHAYTYWSYRFKARLKDIGWRLDYFVVSGRLLEDVCDCVIRKNVYGSDHCPLVLTLATKTGDPLTTPTKTGDPSTTPAKTGDPSTIPTKTGDPSTMPAKAGDPSTTPTKTRDPSTTPTKTGDPSTTPAKSEDPLTIPAKTTEDPSNMPTKTGGPSTTPANSGDTSTTLTEADPPTGEGVAAAQTES